MRALTRQLVPAFLAVLVFTLICGVAYPLRPGIRAQAYVAWVLSTGRVARPVVRRNGRADSPHDLSVDHHP